MTYFLTHGILFFPLSCPYLRFKIKVLMPFIILYTKPSKVKTFIMNNVCVIHSIDITFETLTLSEIVLNMVGN